MDNPILDKYIELVRPKRTKKEAKKDIDKMMIAIFSAPRVE